MMKPQIGTSAKDIQNHSVSSNSLGNAQNGISSNISI